MHIVFQRRKKSFLIIEMKLRHCITLQKNTEKTILLYITLKARLQLFTVLFSFSMIALKEKSTVNGCKRAFSRGM